MHLLILVLLIVATVCFVLATFVFSFGGNTDVNRGGGGHAIRFNLVAMGLLAWVLTALIPAITGATK